MANGENCNGMVIIKRVDHLQDEVQYSVRRTGVDGVCDACKHRGQIVAMEWPLIVYAPGGGLVNKRAKNFVCVECFKTIQMLINSLDVGGAER